ncbi:MAG: helix-turn-helix domain-containing protein [Acidobacteria bacterium]|nr:helix-turn-helix domain-containing protein [Acidobacteriota bacterium]
MQHELTQQDRKISQQPAGVVSVREVLTYFDSDRFFSKAELAKYLSISTRTIESHLPEIPHYRLFSSMLLFKKSEIDRWMEAYREGGTQDLDQIVDGAIEALKENGSNGR